MRALAVANLALRFLLELCAYAALGWWGWTVHWILAVVAPLAAIVLWWRFAAPKADVSETTRLVASLLVFALASVALAAAGEPWLALAFAAVVTANAALLRALPDPELR